MPLQRLVYYCENRLNPVTAPLVDQMSLTLSVSVGRNRLSNITGGLVYDSCWFAQVLEGEPAAIDNAFAQTARELPHDQVVVLERAPISERRFGYWWMACAGNDKDGVLRAHGCGRRFDPRKLSGEALTELIAALVLFDTQYIIPPAEASGLAMAPW